MILKPMVRNNVCINAHPGGCAVETGRQIEAIRAKRPAYDRLDGPKAVLVVGCSTGYGLASRIAAAFGFGAATLGVSYERGPSEASTGTPGWYNNRSFDAEAGAAGLVSRTFDGDAFSAAMKEQVIAAARGLGLRFDLVVYSLASPARTDPGTGTVYRSAIKPIGGVYRGKTVDPFSSVLSQAEVQPATEDEIAQTVKVMGGEDWALWLEALRGAGALAPEATTVAYSYVGPELSWPIYRDGTIGRAKSHLEATAKRITETGAAKAYVSINKALVTRASAVIPVIPLYVSILYKVMKERGIHEDCIDQIDRLFRDRLYSGSDPALDAEGRIRIDELEMGAAVQAEVASRMARVDETDLAALADVEGFRSDFLRAHGFAVEGIDYEADVSPYGEA
ncbi:MAG TPA: enoyl-ACP reductase FabV [Rectinemataceae bacterium]|nr:enoyl-ACP reductase FabV [Rectinemataceae bacterium]